MRWKHTHIHSSTPNLGLQQYAFRHTNLAAYSTLGTQTLSVCVVHSLARKRRCSSASNRTPASLCYRRPRHSQRGDHNTKVEYASGVWVLEEKALVWEHEQGGRRNCA
ncbi:hypothetical protein COCC4DRAFT_131584 [Bipolaris maydis ATCC 48331]|uniref:Uncharacterized protein n=2 Tax=Cochliobolus heterostrophus TaxID=5016 RepID=M2U776_COCH5|nr:uncharacterized protein COCC4DRAFT_131584 [Bipolaris maydis ATCC 48331]EMD94339.1 hypothetical protein COCHEDRAFT_1192456 [Bipolaris maydis C5]ENI07365.1 hypothetical protein COCC4DRAFT_131584 [Bipolaris maydis ATCC 48331]